MTLSLALLLFWFPARVLAAGWPALDRPARAVGGGEGDAAVVVGIERYAFVPPVPGAKANALAWYDHLTKTRKIPPSSVVLLRDSDGTLEEMRAAVDRAAARASANGTLWFIFIGHGAPSKDGRDGLLIGADAQQKAASLQDRSLPREDLFRRLLKSPAGSVRVVLDACFSGRGPGGAPLAPGLQPLVTVVASGVKDPRLAVLTAARGDQFAGALPGEARPAASYLALGGLRGWADADRDGRVTAAELLAYVRGALDATLRGRRQTPTLLGPEQAVFGPAAGEAGPDISELAKLETPPERASLFRVTALAPVPRPALSPDLGESLGSIDVGALEKYDAALKAEKSGASPEAKAAAWRALAAGPSEFKKRALERAAQWERFAATESARREAREKDWAKLSRLFTLDVVSKEDKARWATEFLAAYGEKPEENPHASGALAFVTVRDRLRAGLRAADLGPGIRADLRRHPALDRDVVVYERGGEVFLADEPDDYSLTGFVAAVQASLDAPHPARWASEGPEALAALAQASISSGRLGEVASKMFFDAAVWKGKDPAEDMTAYNNILNGLKTVKDVRVGVEREGGKAYLVFARGGASAGRVGAIPAVDAPERMRAAVKDFLEKIAWRVAEAEGLLSKAILKRAKR